MAAEDVDLSNAPQALNGIGKDLSYDMVVAAIGDAEANLGRPLTKDEKEAVIRFVNGTWRPETSDLDSLIDKIREQEEDTSGIDPFSEDIPDNHHQAHEDMSPDEKAELEDMLRQAAEDAQRRGQELDEVISELAGRTEKAAQLFAKLKALDKGTHWAEKLASAFKRAADIMEVYKTSVQSRRIEGQLGGRIEVSRPKRFLLSIDCSGSMTEERFRFVVKELQGLWTELDSSKFKPIADKIEVLVWLWGDPPGGSHPPIMHTYRGFNKSTMLKIFSKSTMLGGTHFMSTHLALFQHAKMRRQVDLMVVFTDGEFYDGIPDPAKINLLRTRIRQRCRNLIWVKVGTHSIADIAKYDPHYKRNAIVTGR